MRFTAVVIPALSPDIELQLVMTQHAKQQKYSAEFGRYNRNCLSSYQEVEVRNVKIRYDM